VAANIDQENLKLMKRIIETNAEFSQKRLEDDYK
jgi:non-homologous end joining protein Ku